MDNKSKYNPDIHNRRSIRLKGYDYSLQGLYFITICTQDRKCQYGEIINGEMILNDAGKMIDSWCQKLPEKFSGIFLDEYVIMPNHFHAIIEITDNSETPVGVDPSVHPETLMPKGEGQTYRSAPAAPTYLYSIVQWFKTMTTNEYIRGVKQNGWKPFDKRIWQRNYHDHIIRDQQSYLKISDYIRANPLLWKEDKFYSV